MCFAVVRVWSTSQGTPAVSASRRALPRRPSWSLDRNRSRPCSRKRVMPRGSAIGLMHRSGDLTRPPPSNPENLRVACLNLLAHPFHRHGILFHDLDLAERLAAGLLLGLQVLRTHAAIIDD